MSSFMGVGRAKCGQFSRDQFIIDGGPPEKLCRELEEELKTNSEEPRSHAWYHGAIPRQVAESLVQRDGDFLVRDSLSSPGSYVLTCQWRNAAQHFKINKQVIMLNEAYSRVQYSVEREGFDSVPALIRYYVGNRKPVSQVVGAIVFQPINRGLPLRCLEEKLKDRCGSQPASLNQVQERRRPLKTHQSESFLPLGCRPQAPPPDPFLASCNHKTPVFRTGSQSIRGSDSQLCPRPPPKPSKVPSLRQQQQHQPPAGLSSSAPREPSPGLPSTTTAPPLEGTGSSAPPVPPVKPLKLQLRLHLPVQGPRDPPSVAPQPPVRGHVERLRQDGDGMSGGRAGGGEDGGSGGPGRGADRSSYHNAIAALESATAPGGDGVGIPADGVLLPPAAGGEQAPGDGRAAEVARILGVSSEVKGQMGVDSGLELVTLPHGQQLRLDLMESVEERASTLNRIILVSLELKDSVGDLYAFTAMMKALDLPTDVPNVHTQTLCLCVCTSTQISRLEHTWTTLRRCYTQTAITYEKTLKPFYKSLYECTGRPAQEAPWC
ncbi:hypothetical protein CRUP_012637 [Coryphaenoides rupestris]|nr:hypothetical protein CRUP_012637 [Coryphaenoides rupestris]